MYDFLGYHVSDAMTPNPTTIRHDSTLADAEAIFEKFHFNSLPVVDEEGRLVGVVTRLDLLRAFRFTPESLFPPYQSIMRCPISEVMHDDVATVTPRTPLTRVLERMVRTRHSGMVVEEEHKPVGMITRRDLLEALRRAVDGETAAWKETPAGGTSA